jgi:DNA-directed RNA polymerase subunit RPC12/RpoP
MFVYCSNCGAKVNIEMNLSFVFCQYCGSKNKIETEEMKTPLKLAI